MTEPYTRDEIERLIASEACADAPSDPRWCIAHEARITDAGECRKAPLDLLAIIRQLLDQTDHHLQAAKDLMADRPDDGDVFAAQTHAMIAIAESLRSGTIERTETVTHYEPFQIPCERCAGSGTDPEARPDAQNRPEMASGVGNAGFHADGPAGPSGGIKLRPNPVIEAAIRSQADMALADDEVIVKLPPKMQGIPPDALRTAADWGPSLSLTRESIRAIADGIDRKEIENIENPEDLR